MDETLQAISKHTDASISTIHHTLRAPRRRLVILILANKITAETASNQQNTDSTQIMMTARELAKCIVAIEQDVQPRHATGDAYHNVYNSLTQVHLDRLNNTDVIEYQPNRKLVSPGPNLFAMATIATFTTPLTHIMFNPDDAEIYSR